MSTEPTRSVRLGRVLASPYFHLPQPPWDSLEVTELRLVLRRRRQVVACFDRAEVAQIEMRYRRLPLEARSVVAVERADGAVTLFGPLRLKRTGWDLVAAGWPVVWRFRWPVVRRAVARSIPGSSPEAPRWIPLLGPRDRKET